MFKNGRVEIIANDQGNRITPSYVAFTAEGERLIGDGAKNQLTTNPENTVFDAKRLIGRTWDDATVQKDITYFPFKVIEKNKKPHIQLKVKDSTKTFAAEEISAMVLTKMKVNLFDNKWRSNFNIILMFFCLKYSIQVISLSRGRVGCHFTKTRNVDLVKKYW